MNLQETLNTLQQLKENSQKAIDAGRRAPIALDSIDMAEKMARNLFGDYSQGKTTIQEALTTTDSVKLIPKVIEGKLREAAEPEYLGELDSSNKLE